MPGRAAELIEIPASLWQRAEALDALRQRDIGRLFQLYVSMREPARLAWPSPAI